MSIRSLSAAEWRLLRAARLTALSESPRSFLSSYERQQHFDDRQWQDDLRRGVWLVFEHGTVVRAILGATPEPDVPTEDRYLSYLWVAPEFRRQGVGRRLVRDMLEELRVQRVSRVWLWVLDGNEAARALYGHLGFAPSGHRQPLRHDPRRHDERFTLLLGPNPVRPGLLRPGPVRPDATPGHGSQRPARPV